MKLRFPSVSTQVPAQAETEKTLDFSATADPNGVPALAYHWDFGDGISKDGPAASHAYTQPGVYAVQLKITGLDGVEENKTLSLTVQGTIKATYDVKDYRRLVEDESR